MSSPLGASLSLSAPAAVLSPPAERDAHPGQARWFAEEIQVHERSLRIYLRATYPALRDVDDLVQEVYARILRARLFYQDTKVSSRNIATVAAWAAAYSPQESGSRYFTSGSLFASSTGGTVGFDYRLGTSSVAIGEGVYPWSSPSAPPAKQAVTRDFLGVTRGGSSTSAGAFEVSTGNSVPSIATTSLPGGTVGTAYSQTLAATGGDGTLVWSLDAGTLPAGLSLSSGGVISGTPTTAATANFTVRVADSDGVTGPTDEDTQALSIVVNAAPATPPTFVAAGTITYGTGTIQPALPAGIATDDILLLFIETADQAVSISNSNGGTWAQVAGSPQGTATDGATRLTVYWSRYNGTQGAPTVSDSGDHQIARMIAIRGAVASGNPWDVTAGGVDVRDNSASIPGATTTVANTLVVLAVACSVPDSVGTTNFSGWSNANLTNLTERTDDVRDSGNGGALGIATGEKATAGAYGNTVVNQPYTAVKGMISIAIRK